MEEQRDRGGLENRIGLVHVLNIIEVVVWPFANRER